MSSSYRNRIHSLLSLLTVGASLDLGKRRSLRKRGGLFEFLETRQLLSVTTADTSVTGPISHAGINFSNVTFQVTSGTLTDIEFTTLPPNGSLQFNNTAVTVGEDIPVTQLANLTYTPNQGFGGPDVAQWDGSDDGGSTFSGSPSNLTLNVNHQPTLSTINANVTHNPPASSPPLTIPSSDFTGAFSDADNDSLQFVTFTSTPTNGNLTFNGVAVTAGQSHTAAELANGTLLYIPNAGYVGPDSIGWNASDGIDNAVANSTVSITVVNHPPAITPVTTSILHDQSKTFQPSDFTSQFTDTDGDSLQSITITSMPTNGTLTLANSTVTLNTPITPTQLTNSPLVYTPNAGFTGSDTFNWTATDGFANSSAAAVNLTITDTAPTLAPIAIALKPNIATPIPTSDFSGAFTDTDAGDTLKSVTIVSVPTHGTLKLGNATVSAGENITLSSLANLTYTSSQDFLGADSFQWNASDGALSAANNSVANITVADARPVLSNTTIHAPAGNSTPLSASSFLSDFSDSDPGDTLQQVVIKTLPAHGTLTLTTNGTTTNVSANQVLQSSDLANLTYVPDPSYTSSDAFTWNASDGSLFATSDATVTLSTDNAPVLSQIAIVLLVSGSHTFSVHDFDPTGNGSGKIGYSDQDGQPLASITITSLPSNGTLSFNGTPVVLNQTISAANIPLLVYTTNLSTLGTDVFNWTASDGILTAASSAAANLIILDPTITTSGNLTVNTGENLPQTILGSSFNAQFGPAPLGSHLPLNFIQFSTLPAHGTLTVNGAVVTLNQIVPLSDVTYTPNTGFSGTDSFTWAGSTDGTNFSATPGTVSITVTGPTDSAFSKFLPINTTSTFNASDFTSHFSAFNNAPLASIRITTLPAHGTLKIGGVAVTANKDIPAASLNSLTYTPKAGFTGSDSFSWTGSDGTASGAPVAVSITLLPALSVLGRNIVIAQSAKPNVLNGTDFQSWTIAADPSMGADTRTFAIRNSTQNAMNFSSITSTGANKNDFRIQPPAVGGFTVQPGDLAVFTVQFLPHGVGLRTATIVLRNAAGAIVFQMAVQGTALATRTIQTHSLDSSGNPLPGIVQVATTKTGSGAIGTNGVIISMSYTGYLANGGTIFDETSRHGNVPLTFRLDNDFVDGQPFLNKDQANFPFGDGTTSLGSTIDISVIAGWEFGLQGIKPGEHRTLIISSNAGYGANGNPNTSNPGFSVPANATLVFDVVCSVVAPKPQVEQLQTGNTFTITNTSTSSSFTNRFLFLDVASDNANGTPLATWKTTSNLTFGGPHGADFSFTGPVQDSTAPSGFDVSITFHPLTTGVKHENLSFTTNDPKNPKITLELVGTSSKYSDLSVGFDSSLNLPLTPVIAGSGQTVTVPVTVSNTGDSTFPGNSITNVQVYANNTSTGQLTLVAYVNNINLSGLEVRGIKQFNVQIALPLDDQSPFGAFASGAYTFTAVVNAPTRTANSSVSGLVLLPPNDLFTTMIQGGGNGANQTMTDNDTADTGSAAIVSKKAINRFIDVAAGQYVLGGSLGASTIVANASGAHGTININLQNMGNIFTIPSQLLSVDIIANPVDNVNFSSATLVNNFRISPGHIGPGGSLNLAVPVNFSGSLDKTINGVTSPATYVLLARVELIDTGGNVIGGQQVISLDNNLNPVLLNA